MIQTHLLANEPGKCIPIQSLLFVIQVRLLTIAAVETDYQTYLTVVIYSLKHIFDSDIQPTAFQR